MAPPAVAAAALKDCWGCRLVCGAGLLGAGGYVLAVARRVMKSRGVPPGMGMVAQIVFGVGLASWGVVVLVDPVNNTQLKSSGR